METSVNTRALTLPITVEFSIVTSDEGLAASSAASATLCRAVASTALSRDHDHGRWMRADRTDNRTLDLEQHIGRFDHQRRSLRLLRRAVAGRRNAGQQCNVPQRQPAQFVGPIVRDDQRAAGDQQAVDRHFAFGRAGDVHIGGQRQRRAFAIGRAQFDPLV